jgi:hypothetical protein
MFFILTTLFDKGIDALILRSIAISGAEICDVHGKSVVKDETDGVKDENEGLEVGVEDDDDSSWVVDLDSSDDDDSEK